MLDFQDNNILAQLLNTTWGVGGAGNRRISGTVQNERLILKFSAIVTFASERSMKSQTTRMDVESSAALKDVVKKLKSDFKSKAGKTLKMKEKSAKSFLELMQVTAGSPRKVVHYRRHVEFELNM
jgi:hypothetical protein